jgi:hypothetical protein
MKSVCQFRPWLERCRRTARAVSGAVLAVVLSLHAVGHAAGALAAELVMFESETCTWCERFDKEIGPIYPKAAESSCAPLRRVDIHDPRPADLVHIKGVLYTPTFVLVEDGHEVSRLTGYPGEDFFWSLLARDLKKLHKPCDLR